MPAGIEYRAAIDQVKRNFGYNRQDSQAGSVFFQAAGVHESFDQKKAEQWKCQRSDHLKNKICSEQSPVDIHESLVGFLIVSDIGHAVPQQHPVTDCGCGDADHHCDDGDDFDRASGQFLF